MVGTGMSNQSGAALLGAIIVLLGLTLITTGLLVVTVQESATARAVIASMRARFAAESAVHAVLNEWRTPAMRDLGVGETRQLDPAADELPGGSRYRASIERLSPELFLVTGEGWIPERLASTRVGRLVRTLEPNVLQAGLNAALITPAQTTLEGSTIVDATGQAGDSHGACPTRDEEDLVEHDGTPGVLLHSASDLVAGPDVIVLGEPDIHVDPEAADPEEPTGLLSVPRVELLRIADRVEAGQVQIGPVEADGRCDLDALGNWGAPEDAASPCADYFPLIVAPEDVEISDGTGQGVLVALGDLRVSAETRFHGAVYVAGRLLAAEGGTISGAVRLGPGSSSSHLADAHIVHNACDLSRALRNSAALDRPVRPAGRAWIPLF